MARSCVCRNYVPVLIYQNLNYDLTGRVRASGDRRIGRLHQANRFTIQHAARDGRMRCWLWRWRRRRRLVICFDSRRS